MNNIDDAARRPVRSPVRHLALLAGGALMVVAAAGCNSNSKSASSSPAAAGQTAVTGSSSADVSATSPTPSSSADTSTAPHTSSTRPSTSSSTMAVHYSTRSANPSGARSALPTGHTYVPPPGFPAWCQSSNLTVSLAPRIASQGPSYFVIAVKNTGGPCTLFKVHPLVWIWSVPMGKPVQTLPMTEAAAGAPPMVMAANETKYSAVNLWPHFTPNGGGDPTYLAVIANPVPTSSMADQRNLWLPAGTRIDTNGPSLGAYKASPAGAMAGI